MSELQTDLARYNNDWYYPGPLWKRISWHIVGRLFISTYLPIPIVAKIAVLRAFGARIGSGVVIKPAVTIKYPWFLSVENNTWIGEKVWIDNLTKVTIGRNVCLSQGAMLLTGNHDYTTVNFELRTGEIHLEEGVWIGAKAVVCPNVTCHSHAVLTVNSVATKDLEAFSIYQGNPAVKVKKRQLKSD